MCIRDRGTVELWAAGGDGTELPQMFEEFQKANPDVKINMTQIPEDDFVSKMTAAISADTVPDLVYLFTEFQPTLLATGGFSPVPDGLVDEDEFFDTAWETSVVDDVQYGVPWYTYARPFQYRADLAEAAGATPPTDWKSLTDFLQKLQDSGVKHPLSTTVAPFNAYTAMEFDLYAHQNGGGLIADDLSEWTINSPENVEALEFFGSLYEKGYTSPDEPAALDKVAYMTEGKIAGVYVGPWFRGWLSDANGQDWLDSNMGVAEPIAGPDGTKAAMIGGGNWAVPTGAKNPTAAWKFVQFMSETEQQVKWYEIFGNLPAVESAWDEPAIADSEILAPIRDSLSVGVTIPRVSTWSEVGLILSQQIERVARGTATAQEALDAAQAEAESIGVGN